MKSMNQGLKLAACVAVAALSACSKSPVANVASTASAYTQQANQQFADSLPLDDPRDFDDAKHGFIARPEGRITAADGRVLINLDDYKFVAGPAPATVNPSLWRHARLNAQIGLFKVTDGIYQLRGFDIANITLIEGKTGWIVVDALTCRETAAAALAFARQHLGNRPVSALVFTHSHVDHFGGALGVISPDEVAQRKVPVVAPAGFMDEATSENVMVGTAMGRRSYYQFGRNLPHSATGNVDTGLGKNVAYGSFGILQPNTIVDQPNQELTLDGVRFVFHNVPGAEAPAELSFNIPALKAYGGAENLAQTMHNLLPVRGAKVRDALRWSGYMQQALDELGDGEVYFGQHNWPIWGHERITTFIKAHRDVYKYLHDQTVRLINAGLTPDEIAEQVTLPKSLAPQFGARGYYGDVRHNVRAVYQFYLGAYDGNPAHLNRLAPQDMAKHYVELLGGSDKLVAAAQTAYDKGDYRWAVELLNHAVFGAPQNAQAKELLAATYEQLGYSSEASTWRNSYLTAADELRKGPPQQGMDRSTFIDMLEQTPIETFLRTLEAGLNGPAAEGKNFKINLRITDSQDSFVLWIENAVLHHKRSKGEADANATLNISKKLFVRMMAGTAGLKDTLFGDQLKVEGSKVDLLRFLSLIDKADGKFQIVTKP